MFLSPKPGAEKKPRNGNKPPVKSNPALDPKDMDARELKKLLDELKKEIVVDLPKKDEPEAKKDKEIDEAKKELIQVKKELKKRDKDKETGGDSLLVSIQRSFDIFKELSCSRSMFLHAKSADKSVCIATCIACILYASDAITQLKTYLRTHAQMHTGTR